MQNGKRRSNFTSGRFIGLLVAALLGVSTQAFAASRHPGLFPLEKGRYWIYQGETKYLVPKENATEEEKQSGTANEQKREVLTWKMEVVDTLERPGVYAALIKGSPWDLAWYKPGKARGDYVILRVGEFRYYQYSGEAALELWGELRGLDPRFIPSGIKEGELILDFPLAPNKAFGGDFSALLRKRYCWVVEGESPLDKTRFRGAEKFPEAIEYSLTYRTNPDHQFLNFATGVGIVSYVYGHHGTLSETDLELIEFGKAGTPAESGGAARKN